MQPYISFLGLDNIPRPKARATILAVPYDSTTSYRTGTRAGPSALLQASEQVELHDHVSGFTLDKSCFHLRPPLQIPHSSPRAAVTAVKLALRPDIGAGRIPVVIGGEHSISSGAVAACAEKHDGITVVQVDAHADLRNKWNNTPWSHACVMRRILEIPGVSRIIQIGIRNASDECCEVIKNNGHTVIWAHSRTDDWPERVSDEIGQSPVYLTIDLDGLDPSIMPAVGTPEPGGLMWSEMERLCRLTWKWNLVGLDMVELMPLPGIHAPDFLAAKLLYLISCGIITKQNPDLRS